MERKFFELLSIRATEFKGGLTNLYKVVIQQLCIWMLDLITYRIEHEQEMSE